MSTTKLDKAIAHERRRAGETALSDFAEYVEKKQRLRQSESNADGNGDGDEHDELDILDSLGLSDESKDVKLKDIILGQTDQSRSELKEMVFNRIKEGRGETMFDIGFENNLESMKLTKEEYNVAFEVVNIVAKQMNAGVTVLLTRNTGAETDVESSDTDVNSKVLIRRKPESIDELLEIRVAVVGNGKFCRSNNRNIIYTWFNLQTYSRCRKVNYVRCFD